MTMSSGARPSRARSSRSLVAARNGSSGKPLKISGVLIRAPDAGGQVLLLHGIGHDDEMGGDPGGVTFRSAKQRVGHRTLKGAEGWPVNGVEDDRHAGAGGGEPPQDAGLAAVRVDDVGPAGAKQLGELPPGQTVFPRVKRADQFRHDGEQGRAVGEQPIPASLPVRALGRQPESTSTPGFSRRPSTDAIVFSWAPPTIKRVMTCVTRIRCGQGEPGFSSFRRSLTTLASAVLVGALAR